MTNEPTSKRSAPECGFESTQSPGKKECLGGTASGTGNASSQNRWVRDPDLYFGDGSVILLAEDVLFKVHISLLIAKSEVFRDMFDMPLGSSDAPVEGTSDEHPIVIPSVKASEFRNLLKMIYFSHFNLFQLVTDDNLRDPSHLWMRFNFFTDISHLSHRFGMNEYEEWAAKRLRMVTTACTDGIVLAFIQRETESTVPTSFLRALAYAKLISDIPLEHNIRNMVQFYSFTKSDIPLPNLLATMHAPGLREEDPALFGYWFTSLLIAGHKAWNQEPFTRQDRTALFSAQCYLTPIPVDELGEGLVMPLLSRPDLDEDGDIQVLVQNTCRECLQGVSKAWRSSIPAIHYEQILSNDVPRPFYRLKGLAYVRLLFARAIGELASCPYKCGPDVLSLLDRDLHTLYTRLAAYYKDIE